MISIVEFYNNFRDKNELHQVLIKENWQIGVMEEFALSYAKEQLSDFINWHNENYTITKLLFCV